MTDHEAFTAAFRQSRRNIPYWIGATLSIAFLPNLIGVAGSVFAALFVILLCVFAAEALFSVAFGLFMLAAYPFRHPIERADFQVKWVAASVLLRGLDSAIYLGATYYIGLSVAWWGLL